jgi:hypothetical protein
MVANKRTWRDGFYKLAPSWLVGTVQSEDEGEYVWYSLTVIMDAFLERALQSVKAKFPTYAPSDAFQYLSRDRKIIRGRDETDAGFATRLLRYLDDHRTRGNPYVLMEQIRAYMGVDVLIRTVDARGNWYTIAADGTRSYSLDTGNWEWDSEPAANWSRFWVIIYPDATLGPWTIEDDWGDATLWGDGLWGHPTRSFGMTSTPEDAAAIRTIIRDWKPAGTLCEWIIIAFDSSSFDPAAPEPSGGDYVNWHKGGGTAVPARLSTARYWRGTEHAG